MEKGNGHADEKGFGEWGGYSPQLYTVRCTARFNNQTASEVSSWEIP